MTTIRDVAKEAGVSVATVSRVINGKKVSADTKSLVKKTMVQMNYTPSNIARSLTSKKTNTVALIIPSLNNQFFPNLAHFLEVELYKHNYNVFLYSINDGRENLLNYFEYVINNLVDGVIIDSDLINEDDLKYLQRFGIPVVLIDRLVSSGNVTTVSVQNFQGAKLASQHLIDVGCRRIGHLKGTENEITAKQRFWGYRTIANKYDWFDQTWITQANFSVEGGYKALKELMIRHNDLDGVFAANDLSAIGALKAAYELGLKVPDDLAIIGFDGIEMTNYMIPELSTMVQPLKLMCEQAVKELIKEIKGEKPDIKNHEFEVTLRINESTMK